MIKIVVDMQGGDNGYQTTVPAVKRFLQEYCDAFVYITGEESVLGNEFSEFSDRVKIIHASELIPMEAGALDVLRLRDSGIMLGLEIIKGGNAEAIVSAGSTGGFLSACTVKLKTIPGIKRAALVSPFPTFVKGKQTIVLDIGANNENSVEELAQFALMGRIYSQRIVGVESPKTYLLSNGSEDLKGSPLVKETGKYLTSSLFPGFKGNIEANNALNGEADVLVCDGFTGNVFLKSCEGILKFMSGQIKQTFKRNIFTKFGYVLCRKGVKNIDETMKYKHLGGAMLLGINGVCVKAHGNSKEEQFFHSIRIAYQLVKEKVVDLLKEGCGSELN